VQNAGRDLVQNELVPCNVDGMASVRAALVTSDEVRAGGEDVHDFAFALVAPLRADDNQTTILIHTSTLRVTTQKPAPRAGTRERDERILFPR
jgi:hypothetical protein